MIRYFSDGYDSESLKNVEENNDLTYISDNIMKLEEFRFIFSNVGDGFQKFNFSAKINEIFRKASSIACFIE